MDARARRRRENGKGTHLGTVEGRRRRVALRMWYRGEGFVGWQSQPDGPSVQDALARALAPLGGRGRPMAAGRTDRGVHARAQVVSARVDATVSLDALTALAESGWAVTDAVEPAPAFHAQWSAVGKEYRYRLASRELPPAWKGLAWVTADDARLAGARLDVGRLAAALERATGTRDFGALHAASSVRRARTLTDVAVAESRGLVEVRVRGDAFGRYGVRLLVGTAALVASGRLAEGAWDEALATGARVDGLRAPASGLTLWEVTYPPALDPFATGTRGEAPAEPPFVALAPERS